MRWYLPRTALACLEAGWDWPRSERALLDEVAPHVASNLVDVAGEWAGFDPDWLFSQIENHRPGVLDRARSLVVRAGLSHLIEALRKLHGAPQLEQRWLVLDAMAHLYLEEDWLGVVGLWRFLGLLLGQERAELEETWERILVPAYSPLVEASQAGAAELQWRRWLEFHSAVEGAAQGWGVRRGIVAEVCEELTYVMSVAHLNSTPRAGMVVEKLVSLGFDVSRLRELKELVERLGRLFPSAPEARVRSNWEALRGRLEASRR